MGEAGDPRARIRGEMATDEEGAEFEETIDEQQDSVESSSEAGETEPAESTEPQDAAEPAGTEDASAAAPVSTVDRESVPSSLASEGFRTWTDNTGTYSTKARLVEISQGKVRLLKTNGRTATVPFRRLSATDREFVASQPAGEEMQLASLN